jgi:nicotinamidase-related amidase
MWRKEEISMEVAVPEYEVVPRLSVPPRHTAVIILDMQVDFVYPQGKLCVPDALQTVAAIRLVMETARKAEVPIIFTQDWHRSDDPEFSIWPEHTVEESPGAEIIAEFSPRQNDFFIRKRTYDPFFSTELDLLLRQRSIRRLVITGTMANVCVLHTAGSGHLLGYESVVPMDAISALTPFDLHSALRQISFLYQGKITTSAGLEFAIEPSRKQS